MQTIKVSIKYDPAHEIMRLINVPEEIKGDVEAIKEYVNEHDCDFEIMESIEMYTNDGAIHEDETVIEIDGEIVDVEISDIFFNSEDDIDFIHKDTIYCDYIQRKVWMDYHFELPDGMEFEPKRLVIQGINNKSYYYIGELDEDGEVDYFMWEDKDVIELEQEFTYGDYEYLSSIIVDGEWYEIED